VVLVAALAAASTSGTMAATPTTGPVCRNTMSSAVAAPTDKRGFVLSKFWVCRHTLAAMPDGFGQGAPVRKAGGVTELTLRTPCPPDALRTADGGFFTRSGA
jgi:hypothetical protein